MRTDRTDFLGIDFDRLTLPQLKRWLASVSTSTPYCYVVTPNVDHVVQMHREPGLNRLYTRACFCLCDSKVLQTLARLRNIRLPLIPGSDLTAIMFSEVIAEGDRIAVVGGDDGLMRELRARYPGIGFTHHAPPHGLRTDGKARAAAAAFIAEQNARFTFLAVGSPQQEMIAYEVRRYPSATGIALCIGASLDFLTGAQRRAPKFLRWLGLEWAFRLVSNPRRLWNRYVVEGPRVFPIYWRWKGPGRRRLIALALLPLLILLAVIGAAILRSQVADSNPIGQTVHVPAKKSGLLRLPPPNALKPLTPEEAAKENAERPFVARPDSPGAKLALKGDELQRVRAVECLAQAIYYEAASEGVDGGRAVAQVVLNRVRHPAYPSSVCGVVYQGSERSTGCQFSFTCDGSLARVAAPALWRRSMQIAEAALSGQVFAPVGHSTHYHADYVLPYWADSLDKSVQIGRHIFYRFKGLLGSKAVFRQPYAGKEPDVGRLPDKMTEIDPAALMQLPETLLPGTEPALDLPRSEPVAQPPSSLLLDRSVSVLIADGGDRPAPAKGAKSKDCPSGGEKQLRPLAAESGRAQPLLDECRN